MWLIFWGILVYGVWVMVLLLMLEEFIFFGEKVVYFGSVIGIFVNCNFFVIFMVMGLSVGFVLVLEKVIVFKMWMLCGFKVWLFEKFEILVLFILLVVVVVIIMVI